MKRRLAWSIHVKTNLSQVSSSHTNTQTERDAHGALTGKLVLVLSQDKTRQKGSRLQEENGWTWLASSSSNACLLLMHVSTSQPSCLIIISQWASMAAPLSVAQLKFSGIDRDQYPTHSDHRDDDDAFLNRPELCGPPHAHTQSVFNNVRVPRPGQVKLSLQRTRAS